MQGMHIPKKIILTKEDIKTWEVQLEKLPSEIKKSEENILLLKNNHTITVVKAELDAAINVYEKNKATIHSLESRIAIINEINSINELRKIEHKNSAEKIKISPQLALIESKMEPYDIEIKKVELYIAIKKANLSLQEQQENKTENERRVVLEKTKILKNQNQLGIIEEQLADANLQIKTAEEALIQLEKKRKDIDKARRQWEAQKVPVENARVFEARMKRYNEMQKECQAEQERNESILLRSRAQTSGALIQKTTILNFLPDIEHNIEIYSQNIQRAQRSIKESNAFLALQKASVLSVVENLDLRTLKHKREEIFSKRTELSDMKDDIILHIRSLDNETSCARAKILEIQTSIASLYHDAEPFQALNHADAVERLEESKIVDAQLNKEILNRKNIVTQHSADIANLEAKVNHSQNQLKKLNDETLLVSLKYRSQELVSTLIEKINHNFNEFYENNPVGKSDEVLICLTEKNNIIQHILGGNISTLDNESQPGEFKSLLDNPVVMKYVQLCGYLRRVQARISYPEKNVAFGQLIESILGDFSLDSKQCQKDFLLTNPPEMNKVNVIQHINAEYEKAEDTLRHSLLNVPEGSKLFVDFYAKGTMVLNKICEKKRPINLHTKIEDMDLKKRILQHTHAVLLNPYDSVLHAKCRKIASLHEIGQSSRWKAVLGVLMMFLGVAMCIAGILGITSPILIPGGAGVALLGLGLFHKRTSQISNFIHGAEKLPVGAILSGGNTDNLPGNVATPAPSAPSYSLVVS